MTRLLAALLLLAVLPTAAGAQDGDEMVTTISAAATRHGISPQRLLAVAWCESRMNRWAIGQAGERGAFQLHPRGELPTFYARGYTDPFDVAEAADFTAARIAEGGGRAWSCAR